MNGLDQYSELIKAGENKTLEDDRSEVKAKIYIKAKDDLLAVHVDHALIGEGTKKCDFMIVGQNSQKTHMVELKGANIDEAFRQITLTVDYLKKEDGLKNVVQSREVLDAYIASPERQKVPNIPSSEEKELARKLASGNKNRPKDLFSLIHFVKVVKKQKRVAENGRQIIISSRAPLELD